MEVLKDRYTITELSDRLKVTDHALRYYEKEFNITIPKDERGRRYYTPDLANIMYQIKNMRDEGLEIKAIKKILLDENIIMDPPPVVAEFEPGLVPVATSQAQIQTRESDEIKTYLDSFKNDLTTSLTSEIIFTRENLAREIYRTKLELGACVENSARKIESKLDKHFQEVDKSISDWRSKKRKGILHRFISMIK